MAYCLCTTGIAQSWELDKDLILLGPWCLSSVKNKELLRDKRYVLLSSPWESAVRTKEAAEYCSHLYKDLLPVLGRALNSGHAVNRPYKYWQVLLGPWLLYFINVVYDRYRLIEEAAKRYPDFTTSVVAGTECRIDCHDTYDFIEKSNDDYFNLKLFSIIVRALYPEKTVESNIHFESDTYLMKRSWKKRTAYRFFNRVFAGNKAVFSEMYHLNFFDMLRLKRAVSFSGLGFTEFISDGPVFSRVSRSGDFRRSLELSGSKDAFSALLCPMVAEAQPRCYVENYSAYDEAVCRKYRQHSGPEAVGSSVGWFFNEEFKFYAAEAASRGARLIDFQHGGGYGTEHILPTEEISRQKDIFYTWGWTEGNNAMARPLPSAHLSRMEGTHRPTTRDILFVSTSYPQYAYQIHSGMMPFDMRKYFNDQTVFFSGLDKNLIKRCLYRPYHDYGWSGAGDFKKACPGIRIMHKGRLVARMKSARIVVIDHPHTSYLEALVINAPCVFYWDHDVHLMRPEAEEYFEKLRQAGFLYKDPDSASAKINEIYHDPITWWQDKARQQARREFCDHYAYADKDWLNIWATELRRFL